MSFVSPVVNKILAQCFHGPSPSKNLILNNLPNLLPSQCPGTSKLTSRFRKRVPSHDSFSHTQSFHRSFSPRSANIAFTTPPLPASALQCPGGSHLCLLCASARWLSEHPLSFCLNNKVLKEDLCFWSVLLLGAQSEVHDIIGPLQALPEQTQIHSALQPHASVLGNSFLVYQPLELRLLGHCQLITVIGKSLCELANPSRVSSEKSPCQLTSTECPWHPNISAKTYQEKWDGCCGFFLIVFIFVLCVCLFSYGYAYDLNAYLISTEVRRGHGIPWN